MSGPAQGPGRAALSPSPLPPPFPDMLGDVRSRPRREPVTPLLPFPFPPAAARASPRIGWPRPGRPAPPPLARAPARRPVRRPRRRRCLPSPPLSSPLLPSPPPLHFCLGNVGAVTTIIISIIRLLRPHLPFSTRPAAGDVVAPSSPQGMRFAIAPISHSHLPSPSSCVTEPAAATAAA